MQINCPNCATSYRIEPSSLGPAGRSLRCVRCRHVWFASDPEAFSAIARAYRDSLAAMIGGTEEKATPGCAAGETASPFVIPDPVLDPAAPSDPEGAEPAHGGIEIPLTGHPLQPITPERDAGALARMAAPAIAPLEPVVTSGTGTTGERAAESIEEFTARRASDRARRRRPRPSGLALAILALAVLDGALIGWRTQIVRTLPQTASLYAAIGLPVNVRGLIFADVATSTQMHNGVPVLVIDGTVANATARSLDVPRLRLSARNAGGQEIYTWTALPQRNALSSGETLTFRSRLASPPPETRDVLVRFDDRRDLAVAR